MKTRFFLLFFMFVFSHKCCAMFTTKAAQQKVLMQRYLQKQRFFRIPEKVPRGLFIFLDESEGSQFEAISVQLLTALSQKAGPIITSTSLLHSFFACQNKTISGEEVDAFLKEGGTRNKNIAWKASNFNEKEWIIKKVDSYLSLLVPCVYLERCGIDINQARCDDVAVDKMSEVELQLGLKINHMKILCMQDVVSHSGGMIEKYFIENVKKIFCLKNEYYTHDRFVYPLWTLYLMGHGSFDQNIAGIYLKTFSKLLDFFEKDICTRLFIYCSCYAGGKNSETVYRGNENSMQKVYSFSIVVEGLSDVVSSTNYTYRYKPFLAILNFFGIRLFNFGRFFTFTLQQRFDLFLNKVAQHEVMTTYDYKELVQQLKFQFFEDEKLVTPVYNTMQIKPANFEWFMPIDRENAIIEIGSVLAKSRKEKIDVATFFKHKKDPKIILIYANDMPFELVVSESITDIVSMVPGSAIHSIAAISAKENESLCVEKWFKIFSQHMPRKIFFIKKLTDAKKDWQNVLIYNDNDQVNIVYTSGGNRYARCKKGDLFVDELCCEQKNKKYDELLSEVNFFDVQQEGFTLQGGIYHRKNHFNCSDECASKMILPKGTIVIDNMNVQYTDEIFKKFCDELSVIQSCIVRVQDNLKQGSLLWIKKCTTKEVCFDDVIVCKDQFYFTYAGEFCCTVFDHVSEDGTHIFKSSLCDSKEYFEYRSKIEERLECFKL